MAAEIPSFTLNNGTKMPSVGMGCWMGIPGENERVYHMCLNAIKAGYRHFDTAAGYGNEKQVGKAIRDSGIPRNEIYLTTKLANPYHGRVKEAFEESLKTLDCGYIDMYLMHWPQAGKPDSAEQWGDDVFRPHESPTFVETWKDMEKLVDGGKVKSIGVSNFSVKNLEILLPECTIVPATNQIEMHPCLPQEELKAYCDTKGIILTAYSPLGQPTGTDQPISLFNNDTIKTLASKLNVDLAQVLLSWGVQRKTVVIPKTENVTRMKNNITLIHLSDEDMKVVDDLHLQPNMHRTLAHSVRGSGGRVFGWTYEELGWNMVDGFVVSK
ncbi:Aldo/keto reductase [Gymnopus androsaceus JB14]|uniref:Aldo/keto reductase n=1 Tax=Gymnopus androsaceus JB14 TaxID=1447944 RepID=A0A6A4HUT2_9AGAR|nr:Aldo/keto reductase [Gymnopus androsaceus JB14]